MTLMRRYLVALAFSAVSCGAGDMSGTLPETNTPACPSAAADSGSSTSYAEQLLGTWEGYSDWLNHTIVITFNPDGTYSYRDFKDLTYVGSGVYSVSGASKPASDDARWVVQITGEEPERGRTTRSIPILAVDAASLTYWSPSGGTRYVTWLRK